MNHKTIVSSFLGCRSAALVVALAALLSGCSRKPSAGFQGYVEGKFVYVASPQAGRLTHLAVERGQTIAASRPMFELDGEPEGAAVREAQQLLRASESRLADLQSGKRPAEIDVTRAQLQRALADQKTSADLLASAEMQYKSGGIPLTELINARGVAESSTARVQELKNDLAVDALPARDQQIVAQREQVKADRASLAQAEWRLQQKQISAPRGGLVFDTLYREGEWVAAGNPVIQLLPPENLELRFFVPETRVGALKIGQDVRVQCDGCTAVPAHITFVSTQSEYTPPVIYSNETRSKLVFLVIAKPSPENAAALHPGQPVEVVLQ